MIKWILDRFPSQTTPVSTFAILVKGDENWQKTKRELLRRGFKYSGEIYVKTEKKEK